MILLKEIVDNKFTLYCDLDGVLVDFVKGFSKISNDPKIKYPKKYEEKYGTRVFWELIKSQGTDFWKNLEWMPNGKQLWKYIRYKNPIIMSTPAMGFKPSYDGKKEWVYNNLGNYKIILTDKKYKYSNKNSILIDDMDYNINPWKGIGILYKSTSDTISKLKKLGI